MKKRIQYYLAMLLLLGLTAVSLTSCALIFGD